MLAELGPLLDGAMEVSPVKMPGGKGTRTLAAKEADSPGEERRKEMEWIAEAKRTSTGRMAELSKYLPVSSVATVADPGAPAFRPYPEYLKAHEWAPSYEEERIARRALAAAKSRGLNHEGVSLRWFRPSPGSPLGEFVPDRREVWLALDQDHDELLKTTLHEFAHVKQFDDGDPVLVAGNSDRWLEADANAWMDRLFRHLKREDGVFVEEPAIWRGVTW